ncbi:MAG: ATP-grasp domain-containing protein [Deltaproteobacteria bacterium]|nr:ATP-grasp domain-containing protein [Deltaproteobacteria bacterium]
MGDSFDRIAIVNRGEPAMRLIVAAREYAHQRGRPLTTIALYTDPDRQAMFVREADESYALGSAMSIDDRDGQRKSAYLNYALLERALRQTHADAAWVGWGFVAEHPEFVELCDRLGIAFIGPSADVMRTLGDKILAKRLAEQAELPVAPWSGGALADLDAACRAAEVLGYPLMLKATAGGGGRGIRRIENEAQLRAVFDAAQREALSAFGSGALFLERMVGSARHVEVQILGDKHGTVWALGVRDCTVQRRNQKLIEETPSPALDELQQRELCDAARRLGERVGYVGAGTVEFLYEPKTRRLAFMEVNTRLQVEHPVTEMVTGIDLVKLQLEIASGKALSPQPPSPIGHAIEVRLNAEDPESGFAPAPGQIERFRVPLGPGLRVDTGFGAGDTIAADFDSMIAKIIAHGRDREEALARLHRALRESLVLVAGGVSNKGFLLELLDRPELTSGEYDIGWLDGLVERDEHLSGRSADIALIHGAIVAYEEEFSAEMANFFAAAARGRPEVGNRGSREIELSLSGADYRFVVGRIGPERYRIGIGERSLELSLVELRPLEWRLTIADRTHRVRAFSRGAYLVVEVDGISYRISRDLGGVIRAPAPAIVVSVDVAEGDMVEAGDRLVVLEAMKTEMAITAKFAGRVRKVAVTNNVQVHPGAELLLVEPPQKQVAIQTAVDFSPLLELYAHSTRRNGRYRQLNELRSLILGFDADEARLRAVIEQGAGLTPDIDEVEDRLWRKEDRILATFADIAALFHPEPAGLADDGLGRLSTKEYFYTFLRDPEGRGEGFPEPFLDKLRAALAHYGVEHLEAHPALSSSLYRLCRSHWRATDQRAGISAILQRWLRSLSELRLRGDEPRRALLDRMIRVTEWRYPALHDAALEVRYRAFELPLLERAQAEIYAAAAARLAELAEQPPPAKREACIAELVACTQPLTGYFSARLGTATLPARAAMVETLLRRHYRIRTLEQMTTAKVGQSVIAEAYYQHDGRRFRVLGTLADVEQLTTSIADIKKLLIERPADSAEVLIDLYMACPEHLPGRNELPARIAAVLEQAGLPGAVRRATAAVVQPGADGGNGTRYLTWRRGDEGLFAGDEQQEEIHPQTAQRIRLWRMSRFNLRRLPSAPQVYLYHALAKDNKKDERLFAVTEVRDLTAVRDERGRLLAMPHLEHRIAEVLAGIRRFQASRPERYRLHWNRIFLHVWPVLSLAEEDLNGLVGKIWPATKSLGIERLIACVLMPSKNGAPKQIEIVIDNPGGGPVITFREPPELPMEPLDPYGAKVVRLKQRGLVYPYAWLQRICPSEPVAQSEFPPGRFVEYDLDQNGKLVPVDRPYGQNTANIVVGLIDTPTAKYPEGMRRVILLGDPSRDMGALAEPECRRIIEAIDLAEAENLPIEWFSLSAGAKISMDSGTENMDWIALVLRRLVLFTQNRGEVNIIVCGINVGAQPYWNAEATMLMHTRGILVMIPESAMVLTGKQALDYSGGVSADDNFGIGGYETIMGPNGQAQYYASDLGDAYKILLRYYDHSYVMPGERFPRRAPSADPADRDVCCSPHSESVSGFSTIGEVFSEQSNPGRKKPFDIRSVMSAVIDAKTEPLERWFGLRGAEMAVVWDSHIGGYPLCLIGLESRPLKRLGFVPADGPEQWTPGTLFPRASKKVARAINAASGNRPVVVLANLSGFDGSPESMRNLQLEYGAEIGRAVVNFKGPIIFCVVSRYHGGAFVVFSARLHDNMQVAALEGAHASVIGGAPAAAVVFAREVSKRAQRDQRLIELEQRLMRASGAQMVALRSQYQDLLGQVRSEKLGEVAEEFDAVHSVQRAQRVGSVDQIVPPSELRRYLVEALERGIERELRQQRLSIVASGHA